MRIVQGIQLSKFILALLSLGIVCIFACKEDTEVSKYFSEKMNTLIDSNNKVLKLTTAFSLLIDN